MQRADHLELAVDRMCRRQQFARRLAAQHVFARRRFQQISRVRLAALELLDGQRAGKAFDGVREVDFKPRFVDAQRTCRVLGA